ncbi:MAG: proton-conducting transporter membrane subunit [Armatimonadota bacterium]|nr:proton-conducting transporter membrane subunit [Armatimonadota bacterium]
MSAALLAGIIWLAAGGQPARVSLAWFPRLGVRYALLMDGLSLLFAGLITAVGVLIFVYSVAYMRRERGLGRFYAFLLLFLGAMLGTVLADDLIVLYIFWELTSLASFFLIGYRDEQPAARAGATQALIVTAAGGVTMLVGLVLLGQIGGAWQISALLTRTGQITGDSRYAIAMALILAGALTKSAQIPFQFWLPSAMVAPTPVSTYLHSATMVWAGVYLMARLLPLLGGTSLWSGVLVPVGLATMVVGTGLAALQNDLKALLAYSTIGALGLATALMGWGSPAAVAAAMAYIINHAAFKAALFMVAGAVEHETGTRLIDRLGALRTVMPITAGVAVVAAFSMAGLPPFGGFLSKEAAVEAFLHGSSLAAGAVVLAGALSLAYGIQLLRVFFARSAPGARAWRRSGELGHGVPGEAHEPGMLLWGPAAVLSGAALAFGLFPSPVEHLAAAATAAVATPAPASDLWHGVTFTTLIVVGATLAGGIGLFAVAPLGQNLTRPLMWLSSGRAYEWLYGGAMRGAVQLTRAYMTGRARDYYVYVIVVAVTLLTAGLAATGLPVVVIGELEPGPLVAILVAIIAAVAAARLRLLVAAVLALGVTGYAISIVYVLLSAPDIAVTQAAVETVSLVLFLVAITALARSDAAQPDGPRFSDAAIALAGGAAATVLAVMAETPSDIPRIATKFFVHAAEAGGKNIVNLVVVDYRGWDTMGEISVLAIAALGIMALAQRQRGRSRPFRGAAGRPSVPRGAPVTADDTRMTSIILQTIARVAAPIIVAYALLLWATGHYGPGGGFVGGLMMASAFVLWIQAFGVGLAHRWDALMTIGLLLAAGSAVVPLLTGAPLLDHVLIHVAGRKFASSLIFDLGVLCLVTGAVMSAVRALVEGA